MVYRLSDLVSLAVLQICVVYRLSDLLRIALLRSCVVLHHVSQVGPYEPAEVYNVRCDIDAVNKVVLALTVLCDEVNTLLHDLHTTLVYPLMLYGDKGVVVYSMGRVKVWWCFLWGGLLLLLIKAQTSRKRKCTRVPKSRQTPAPLVKPRKRERKKKKIR